MNSQLVSVIIPTYNRAPYIRQALESVLVQTYPVHQVIVVDDGSTDGTQAALEPFADHIEYVYQENQGAAAARNHGLRLALGEFVVFLDSDDFLLEDKVAEQLACFRRSPSLGAVHSGWRLVDDRGQTIREVEPWQDAPRLDLKDWLLWKPAFLGAMIIRREWLERVSGFDVQRRPSEDTDLLLRLALAGCKMAWLCKSTACYRQHKGNITQDTVRQARDHQAMLAAFFARPDVPKHIRRLEKRIRYYSLVWDAWRLYHTGHREQTALYLQRALRCSHHALALTVLDWAVQFARHSAREGDSVDLETLLTHFEEAAHLTGKVGLEAETLLRWHFGPWRSYTTGEDGPAAEGLSVCRGLEPQALIARAQSSLVVEPPQDGAALVTRFWRDVLAHQLLPLGHRQAVTGLYLTVFGQAILTRRWSVAGQALAQALRHSWHPRAMAAWGRFCQAAWVYFRARPGLRRSSIHECE